MLRAESGNGDVPGRVVILGGSGFIGRALVRRVEAGGVECVSRSSQDLDLTAPEAVARVRAILDARAVLVFLSAITRERGRDPGSFLKNVQMAYHVVTALAHTACAQILYVSSDAVYGDVAGNPVSERTPCQPTDLYGLMHLVREGLLRDVAQRRHVPLAIVRPTLVYGVEDSHANYGPNRFFRSVAERQTISLFGEGEDSRDFLLIDDLVELLWQIILCRGEGLVNAATGRSTTFAALASRLQSLSGHRVRVEQLPRSVPITHRSYDVSALRQAFPRFAPASIELGLERMFQSLFNKGQA
jgi:nucleoside-diphosphate-sugar epimerase